MTPSSDHVYEIPAWIARSIPARIGPDEEIWAEAYPPAGDHSDLLAFLDSHELVRAPAMYVLGDGTRSETWESWEGAVTSASIWYHGIVPGGAILLDLEYVPEGDIKAAQKIIDSWLYHVHTEEFVGDLPRLEIVRIGG